MPNTSKKVLHEALRAKYMARIKAFLEADGEEVLRTASNEFSVPCVDAEGNDEFIVLTVKVPTGSRDGDPYDGYALADEYVAKVADKAEKAKVAAEKKAIKIAKDTAEREAKARAKAEHEAKKAEG